MARWAHPRPESVRRQTARSTRLVIYAAVALWTAMGEMGRSAALPARVFAVEDNATLPWLTSMLSVRVSVQGIPRSGTICFCMTGALVNRHSATSSGPMRVVRVRWVSRGDCRLREWSAMVSGFELNEELVELKDLRGWQVSHDVVNGGRATLARLAKDVVAATGQSNLTDAQVGACSVGVDEPLLFEVSKQSEDGSSMCSEGRYQLGRGVHIVGVDQMKDHDVPGSEASCPKRKINAPFHLARNLSEHS
jgi:hypothetical protein